MFAVQYIPYFWRFFWAAQKCNRISPGCLGSEVTIQCSRDPNATIAIENATFYHIPYLAINCSRGCLGPVAVADEPEFAQRLVQRTFFPTVSGGVTGCCTQNTSK